MKRTASGVLVQARPALEAVLHPEVSDLAAPSPDAPQSSHYTVPRMTLLWPSPEEARDLLARGITLVLAFDLDAAAQPRGLRGFAAPGLATSELLSVAERKASGRLSTEVLRRRSSNRLAWRRLLLAGVLDVAPAGIDYGREPCTSCGAPHGRPFVSRPSDTGLDFCASSSGHLGVLAVRSGGRVGVDIEVVQGTRLPEDETWLSRDEQQVLADAAHPHEDRIQAWVRKEACVKATGEGLNVELTEVSVLASSGGAAPVYAGMTVRDLSPLPRVLGSAAGPDLGPVALAIHPLHHREVTPA